MGLQGSYWVVTRYETGKNYSTFKLLCTFIVYEHVTSGNFVAAFSTNDIYYPISHLCAPP